MNVRRPHIKNGIGYKMGDKYNSMVNNNSQEFIRFTKGNSHQVNKDNKVTNHVSSFDANASYMLIMLLMHLMFLWKISMEKLLLCMLGHTTRGLRFMCGCLRYLYLT
jgi:hypothetical protein